ncbi:hypothetical protein ACC716_24960 [Rhizobium johnstonii]|uniref:hypothetical protein n=1 Tax=Rhizobium TaxID=379 RepID=UPI000371BD61|nr:hypothetical protein [Rhizobium leguminosarum]MBY5471539.1 hypothetical protein [Rhizobium leguminosarum]
MDLRNLPGIKLHLLDTHTAVQAGETSHANSLDPNRPNRACRWTTLNFNFSAIAKRNDLA